MYLHSVIISGDERKTQVHTCIDSPHALANYSARGFQIISKLIFSFKSENSGAERIQLEARAQKRYTY
ncbi:hypothetical protein NIES2107_14590 [Nostoc carneum NIES-2107]|nr:hypothetical protein NIES2107_14590 [Nostoc carneum NIES-2107]